MKLVWSSKFTRAVKKLTRQKPHLLDDLETALRQLEADPYHPSLRTHKLSGDFDGCWACSAGYDFRIVFKFVRAKGQETEIPCSTSARTTRLIERCVRASPCAPLM